MWLSALAAENFRCLHRYEIEPHQRLNLFVGPNAAGKTSLLESVFTLGRARSFRANTAAELAGDGEAHWRIVASAQEADARVPPSSLRMSWRRDDFRVSLRDSEVSRAELVEFLPVQVIDPAQHRLLEDGPSYRRRYLDWGVFHVEHRFLAAWRRYERALRQRNRALKDAADLRMIQAWDTELAESGEAVSTFRDHYLERLRPLLEQHIRDLLDTDSWSLDLNRGWKRDEGLLMSLERGIERDRRLRQTSEGPHRAELRVRLDQHAVRNRVSRGQQKLLISALVLAQAKLIQQSARRAPILLVDDLPSELGAVFQQRFADVLLGYEGQLFVTSLEKPPDGLLQASHRMFHVEQGQVHPG